MQVEKNSYCLIFNAIVPVNKQQCFVFNYKNIFLPLSHKTFLKHASVNIITMEEVYPAVFVTGERF